LRPTPQAESEQPGVFAKEGVDIVVQHIGVGIGDSGSSNYLGALHVAAQLSRRGRTVLTLVHGYVRVTT
jgi:hypothetical protein